VSEPASWLVAHRHLLPPTGDALDVACGRGRNAIWLAEQGLRTLAIDRDPEAVASVNQAARPKFMLHAEVLDLESGSPFPFVDAFDVIVVVHYLHRPLFPSLLAALRPGGLLVYETYTRAQAARGKPTNPAFLLEPGELLRLVQPLRAISHREGEYEGGSVASVVARRD